jgi:hypothetical protein
VPVARQQLARAVGQRRLLDYEPGAERLPILSAGGLRRTFGTSICAIQAPSFGIPIERLQDNADAIGVGSQGTRISRFLAWLEKRLDFELRWRFVRSALTRSSAGFFEAAVPIELGFVKRAIVCPPIPRHFVERRRGRAAAR